jgi:two-component sensor histidine kinase
MLRELNHRAKNMLQIIASILTLEMRHTQSEEGRLAIARASQRLQIMSQVHSMLYLIGEDIESVEMAPYLRGLCGAILTGLLPDEQVAHCDIQCGDFIWPMEAAGQIGMIAAEVIINACKHAFSPTEPARISINLGEAGDRRVRLQITDNGKGYDTAHAQCGVGSFLIRTFARSLDGTLEIKSKPKDGTEVILSFPRSAVAGTLPPETNLPLETGTRSPAADGAFPR